MASAQEDGGVADPTGGGSRRIKRNAALAAAEQLERLRCLDMMVEYRQCICKSTSMEWSREFSRERLLSVYFMHHAWRDLHEFVRISAV